MFASSMHSWEGQNDSSRHKKLRDDQERLWNSHCVNFIKSNYCHAHCYDGWCIVKVIRSTVSWALQDSGYGMVLTYPELGFKSWSPALLWCQRHFWWMMQCWWPGGDAMPSDGQIFQGWWYRDQLPLPNGWMEKYEDAVLCLLFDLHCIIIIIIKWKRLALIYWIVMKADPSYAWDFMIHDKHQWHLNVIFGQAVAFLWGWLIF